METDELSVLVQAVAAGSLSGAARRLGVTPTVASRRLAALEERLGVRLMHRTTRSVSLTPEGETFLPHAQAMLEIEEAARASLAPAEQGVSGLLRVTAPASFGRKVVAPLVPALLDANPDLRIDLELTDSVVDIAAAGIDVAIRIGRLRESTLIARRLAPNTRVLCAAPSYLERRGTPHAVESLAGHECLVLSGTGSWPFDSGGKAREIRISGRFASNSVEAIREACIGGLGIALLSRWDVVTELASGALVRIDFEALIPQEISIWAVYPSSRLVPPKVRAFIASLESALAKTGR
ncbi:LysR family transcriptional regulator [Skermanella sp. TT6]|uniref:LysR family transcriptional regulator n=1 Tax=Skermanella cutis TaxID=2775420 RepID=A0ABX7B3B3_9PROT|nr:LysR family transcriptional regulator [Skermanella sp. TT6]QQP87917.1 LysR family transcriptional regulator [Skermanella sp. TT6]